MQVTSFLAVDCRPNELISKIESLGIPQSAKCIDDISDSTLLIYESPENAIQYLLNQAGRGSSEEFLYNYYKLLDKSSSNIIVAAWRLQNLSISQLKSWLLDDVNLEFQFSVSIHPIDALTSLATIAYLEHNPQLLDLYKILELKSFLFGGDIDAKCIERLKSNVNNSPLESLFQLTNQISRLQSDLVAHKKNYGPIADQVESLKEELSISSQLHDSSIKTESLLRDQISALQDNASHLYSEAMENKNLISELQAREIDHNLSYQDLMQKHKSLQNDTSLVKLQLEEVQKELKNYFDLYRQSLALYKSANSQVYRLQNLLLANM